MTERQREGPEGSVYVLGGNESTLAFVSSLRPESGAVTAWLVPLAWTPAGVVVDERREKVGIPGDNVSAWVDRTFPASDQGAFVSSARDLDLLLRVGWAGAEPARLRDGDVLNAEDVPEEILEALSAPPAPLVACAMCRRLCERDAFVWNDRQLCAWDFHASVFGRRGPWRAQPYDEHLFSSLPKVPYVATPLLDEMGVDVVLAMNALAETTMQGLVNAAFDGERSFLAVRTGQGLTLLRERPA